MVFYGKVLQDVVSDQDPKYMVGLSGIRDLNPSEGGVIGDDDPQQGDDEDRLPDFAIIHAVIASQKDMSPQFARLSIREASSGGWTDEEARSIASSLWHRRRELWESPI